MTDRSVSYPSTPELDKLTETFTLAEFTQRLGEALDDGGDFVLATWVQDTCLNCMGDETFYSIQEDRRIECERCKGTGIDPTAITLSYRSPTNRNLAKLFGLDDDKMEDERTAVLQYIQEVRP